jgi:hypothetical protein
MRTRLVEAEVVPFWGIFYRVKTTFKIESSYPMLDHDPFVLYTGPLLFRSWAEKVKRQIEAKYLY